MRSSPSDSGAEDNAGLFPSTNDPSTPTQDLRPSAPSPELSPPMSQDQPGDASAPSGLQAEDPMTSNALVVGGEAERPVNGTKGARPFKDDEQDQPGGKWKNKRAQDEYSRAMESVVDKDFNLREFGDPFDPRDASSQGKT